MLACEWIDTTIYGACGLQAAAYAAFIQPTEFTPILCKTIEADLTRMISRLSEEDFKIFAGEEGILVVDVLESMNKNFPIKILKSTEETLIANENVKKQKEQELVNEQLAKEESAVRSPIFEISTRLKRGIRLVSELSKAACSQKWHHYLVPLAVTNFCTYARNQIFQPFRGCK
ncbi:BEM_HP_G0080810.mRNA.1.CDS.1 [Saccharomyces cerevisiae]|nr:BEM_HP_G0080810.mRNA.1.CDS.1 [Saccharomyces cerevisiae]CAI6992499.1 BEM_HP_G0080810.mRNA.1.CDS.1 [Saccharomyces cerevisiae]